MRKALSPDPSGLLIAEPSLAIGIVPCARARPLAGDGAGYTEAARQLAASSSFPTMDVHVPQRSGRGDFAVVDRGSLPRLRITSTRRPVLQPLEGKP